MVTWTRELGGSGIGVGIGHLGTVLVLRLIGKVNSMLVGLVYGGGGLLYMTSMYRSMPRILN